MLSLILSVFLAVAPETVKPREEPLWPFEKLKAIVRVLNEKLPRSDGEVRFERIDLLSDRTMVYRFTLIGVPELPAEMDQELRDSLLEASCAPSFDPPLEQLKEIRLTYYNEVGRLLGQVSINKRNCP